jgi:hypothetical protein
MATVAATFNRFQTPEATGAQTRGSDPFRLRPIPGEDVFFFSKKLDNSRVIRQADPVARRRSVRTVAAAFGAAVMLMILLLPHGLNMMAGYQVGTLEREYEALSRERRQLVFEESRLLSPARMHQMATEMQLHDPDPNRVVFPNATPERSLALNAGTK